MAKTSAVRLEARQITKQFSGVTALDQVDLKLHPGEILALIGENGAGKSTLMKILAGIERPDGGLILVNGKPVSILSVPMAMEQGIALIHQELNLADKLSAAANIMLGREPHKNGMIDRRQLTETATKLLARVGLDIAPHTIVGYLSIGQQQLVEIARALSVNARVLIMDEPTSSLSQSEAETLFQVVRELRDQGVSIIYISHRLGEVGELADRATVLRDGQNAGELNREEITHDAMVRLMVGRDVSQFYVRTHHQLGKPMLRVEDLVVPEHPRHRLNFTVSSGEIVGLAGLVGAGRTELLKVLFGVAPALSGKTFVGDKLLDFQSPSDAIQAGIALVPEDRKLQGLILEMAVRTNVGLTGLARYRLAGVWINRRREQHDCDEMIRRLNIKTPSDRQSVQYLSGGNQQKVVLGKWLTLEPRVLLLDEPTRGIDIGAKQEIYTLMEELTQRGVALFFTSSEMEEILGMSDRVLVMHEGSIAGQLQQDALSEEAVMQLATGRTLEKSA